VCKDGECVYQPKPKCRKDNDCPRDYVCKDGECVYQKPTGCQSDGDCPQGYVCEQGSGKCVSPFDGSYASFTGDLTTRDDQRSQNQADQAANDQNTGQSGNSLDDLTQNIGNVHDQVSKDCYKDSDCPSGFQCQGGQCVEAPGCRADKDCPSGHTCENGSCVPVPAQPSTAQADPDPQPDPQTAASSLAISPPNKVITKSESVAFKASLVKGDGSTEDVTAKASWNPSQNFSSTKIGTHTITATFQNLSASAGVTVVEEKGLGDITVSEKTITVTFWDHGQEDGDMIDINVNGKAVFSGITLTNAPQTRTITMTAGALVFGFTALNEGSVSPNTATVKFTSVVAGKAEQKYSLKKNAKANMNVTYAPK
jgi:Cys-rich repeat protein